MKKKENYHFKIRTADLLNLSEDQLRLVDEANEKLMDTIRNDLLSSKPFIYVSPSVFSSVGCTHDLSILIVKEMKHLPLSYLKVLQAFLEMSQEEKQAKE